MTIINKCRDCHRPVEGNIFGILVNFSRKVAWCKTTVIWFNGLFWSNLYSNVWELTWWLMKILCH